MARLIDDVLSGNTKYEWAPWMQNDLERENGPQFMAQQKREFLGALRECAVFDVTNVSDYFYAGTDKEFWDVGDDFPCPMPPFDRMWMEYQRPKNVVSSHPQTDLKQFLENFPPRVGLLVYYGKISENKIVRQMTEMNAGVRCTDALFKHGGQRTFRKVREDLKEASEYMVQINSYSERDRVMKGPWQILLIWLDKQGNVTDYTLEIPVIGRSRPVDLAGFDNFMYPAVLALSFLNCHNVVTEAVRPEPKIAKAYRKKHRGHNLLTFKRLVIEPVTKIAASRESGVRTGVSKALHICRGHFKEYGVNGKGLMFGKIAGRFWQPSCVRGSSEAGLVAKDYDIHTLEHGLDAVAATKA